MRDAIQNGSDQTLAQDLRNHRRITRAMPRRKPKGGFTVTGTPENAADVLAESEFNRYYIRALARRAIEDGIPELVIYRAKPAKRPRPVSEALIETTVAPNLILDDLRSHPGTFPAFGVPAGPNSGLSVRLP